jgi:DNA-binding NarL/FixJ family response regulator
VERAVSAGVIRVVVADDQALVRAGFRSILSVEPDIEVVTEAADGVQAVEAVRRHAPDVVLMDLRMPVLDGVEATRRITASARARVIAVTTFDTDEHVYDALRAGATGFIVKDDPADLLAGAVRSAHRGDALLSPAVTRRVIDGYVRREPQAPSPALGSLTPRELEVLRVLASGASNAEIAQALFLSEATVKTHITSLFTKLGVRDRVQAVVFAYRSGVVAATS